jgi:hypothetical protein
MISKIRHLSQIVVMATVAIAATAGAAKAENYQGWDYANSYFKNGIYGSSIGGNEFEFYSLAVKDMGDRMVVAINANLEQNGGLNDIAYGDMLFNFTPNGLKGASDSSSLFGVKFTTLNSDSGVKEMGIYSNVTAKTVTNLNHGFKNFDVHRAKRLATYAPTVALTDLNNLGDLQTTDAYFDGMRTGKTHTILNSIDSGTKVGDISLLTKTELGNLGVNFGHFGASGTNTFGFSFVKPKGFDGKFMSTLFAECANDGIALAGVARKSVPEPFALAGLAIVGGALARKRRTDAKA